MRVSVSGSIGGLPRMMHSAKFVSSAAHGVPVTSPTTDASAVQHSVQQLSASYPGEVFVVETAEDEDHKLVVSWIPIWYLPNYFVTLVQNNFAQLPLLEWPDISK
jgi:hypothetical protein